LTKDSFQERLVDIDKSLVTKIEEIDSFLMELANEDNTLQESMAKLDLFEKDASILNVDTVRMIR
jgi:hypothetical protein